MENSVEIIVHIPACQIKPWKYVLPLKGSQEAINFGSSSWAAQEPFLNSPTPMLISELAVDTPLKLLELNSIKQLEIIGNSVLETIENNKDKLNYSILSGRFIHTEGTSIMVTGYESTGENVVFATWDYGVPVEYVLTRLSEAKRIMKMPLEVVRAILDRTILPDLPCPQVVLSNVSAIGEMKPLTCIGGYGDNKTGNSPPIAVAVGIKTINIMVDHRVYNPPTMLLFVREFIKRLNRALDTIAL